jgi:hypothetical protein
MSHTNLSRDFVESSLDREALQEIRFRPKMTSSGIHLARIPPDIKRDILNEWLAKRKKVRAENAAKGWNSRDKDKTLDVSEAEESLRHWLVGSLAAWCNVDALDTESPLEVVDHSKGATQAAACQGVHEFVVGAIIQLAHRGLKEPWLLHVLPHDSKRLCEVSLDNSSFDCVFFEATVPHGRLVPLVAEEYQSVIFRFQSFQK